MDQNLTPEEIIDKVRLLSIATGKIYDIQILNLKSIPLVLFGEGLKNEIALDCDNLMVKFSLTGKCQHTKAEIKERAEHLVQYVKRLLGSKYSTSLVLNEKVIYGSGNGPSEKARRTAKPNRKKSVPRVRKQTKAATKP